MKRIRQKFLQATKDILEKNLQLLNQKYKDKPIVLVYDMDSELSKQLSQWYIRNLENISNAQLIDFHEIPKNDLKEMLLWLEKDSTVILVQSTNFRLDDFRIRLSLHNNGVGCLEHNHLAYIKDSEIENYADAIEYKTDYYDEVSQRLKNICDTADTMEVICHDGSSLTVTWGFEDMKQNTWNYEWKNRGGTFPIGENFNEALDFKNVNGELSIYAYPDEGFQVHFAKPFKIKINNSMVSCDDEKCPEKFKEFLHKIAQGEDGEVYMRELGFWLNPWITKQKTLSDVNAFERIAGFHISLWKKHNIYRKKFSRKVTQRYHIDIFPDVKEIKIDNQTIFENDRYVI